MADPDASTVRDDAELLRLAEAVRAAERAYDAAEASGRAGEDELRRLIEVEQEARGRLLGAFIDSGALALVLPDGTIVTWTLQPDGMEVVPPGAVIRLGVPT